MANLIKSKGDYANNDVVDNILRYILRERENETKRHELLGYGVKGITYLSGIEDIIHQFESIQKLYDIDNRRGRRVIHEYFGITGLEEELLKGKFDLLYSICHECANVYFMQGHQVVFAIHKNKEEGLHVHFVVNTINYRTGKKWHEQLIEQKKREYLFNCIFYTAVALHGDVPAIRYVKSKQYMQII